MCGSSTVNELYVPIRTIDEKCIWIYFINCRILAFPPKILNFWPCFKSIADLKISRKCFLTSLAYKNFMYPIIWKRFFAYPLTNVFCRLIVNLSCLLLFLYGGLKCFRKKSSKWTQSWTLKVLLLLWHYPCKIIPLWTFAFLGSLCILNHLGFFVILSAETF